MKIRIFRIVIYLFLGILVGSCSTQKSSKKVKSAKSISQVATKQQIPKTPKPTEIDELANLKLPSVNREFRAAWVATVANINWPSKNNLTTEQQKAEAIRILDMLKDANFNAVVFQARPSADALYKSDLEPWSYFLTGEIGKAPYPYYDPLEFWIYEAHKRGMELHVWLNPYRAHHTSGGLVTANSMAKKMQPQTQKLRNGMYWMDPSDKVTQDHVSNVIKDIVKRYDIDAVHIDDYFYPYREYHGGRDFPDDKTWQTYRNSGGTMSRADWRRANVNQFIKRIYEEIKAEKNYVRFGISPFGIWKPGYPEDIKGTSQYDELYADAKLWLNEGWLDYFAPQLYWKDGGSQSFSSLLKWWQNENTQKRHLWAGLNTVGVKVADKPAEIANQIAITRNLLKDASGEIHYNVDGISKNSTMLATLKDVYKEKALVPESPWIKTEMVIKPEITVQKSGADIQLKWFSRNPNQVRHWVLYTQYGDVWETEILDKDINHKNLNPNKSGKLLKTIAVKAIDRLGKESDYAAVKIK
ncbi:MAG: family 10 glycosylhydrolase [Cruoricaptor ignavus]|nr:family 10 glycosylhydrolase [Cruoricaptor ignavus]